MFAVPLSGMLFRTTNPSLSSTFISQPLREAVLRRPSWTVPTLLSSRAESANDGLSVKSRGPPGFIKFSWYLATSFIYTESVAGFMLQWQIWAVVTETAWLVSPKYLLYSSLW